MTPSLKKRFWETATVVGTDGDHRIELDGRGVKTPAKATLSLPTAALAEAVAQEWRDAEETVDPGKMPLTRRANVAIDKVGLQHAEIVEMLAEYGGSDLLCYRAETPEALHERQAAAWDPLLEWAGNKFDGRLLTTTGVMHVKQDATVLQNMRAPMIGLDAFELTGFHDLVVLSGSLILALAAIAREHEIEALWNAAQVDEAWQEETWGFDEEAALVLANKKNEFLDAFRFLELL